ncbi:hypothetical protein LAV73_08770 [Lysinibacillus xylanilyticus]|uniref:hypothetical protein n=1 Tax=Lysinibacillus xylanilyticus TaxID=582475 RepID=UPI002B255306|nr:hypothetical protein [Lysinibacillus xylanilyticus]MEB2280088.1 hypothetical protein [Lysinibacillus xylanilyticus]
MDYYYDTFVASPSGQLVEPTENTVKDVKFAAKKYIDSLEEFFSEDYELLIESELPIDSEVQNDFISKFSAEISVMKQELQKVQEQVAADAVIRKAEREKNKVYIGMTSERLLETNWGKPDDINRTITAYGTKEQWIYRDSGVYFYFEDGILVTIQE